MNDYIEKIDSIMMQADNESIDNLCFISEEISKTKKLKKRKLKKNKIKKG